MKKTFVMASMFIAMSSCGERILPPLSIQSASLTVSRENDILITYELVNNAPVEYCTYQPSSADHLVGDIALRSLDGVPLIPHGDSFPSLSLDVPAAPESNFVISGTRTIGGRAFLIGDAIHTSVSMTSIEARVEVEIIECDRAGSSQSFMIVSPWLAINLN